MTLRERINAKIAIDPTTGCWVWMGTRSTKGYGRISVNGRCYQAHRVSYEEWRGSIPEGLCIDHLCRNRACVNPEHLEPVTNRENLLRGDTIPAANMVKTHCVRGHALTEDNVWINRHGRNCRACAREDTRRKYWKAKLRANPALPLTPGAPR